jgi:hypothetical protein
MMMLHSNFIDVSQKPSSGVEEGNEVADRGIKVYIIYYYMFYHRIH